MSHTTNIDLCIKDMAALKKVCQKFQWELVEDGTTSFYDGKQRRGTLVKLPGWRYPIVIDKEQGKIYFDNYGGHWGDIKLLNKLKAHYTIEFGKSQARRMGAKSFYREEENGELVLTVTID